MSKENKLDRKQDPEEVAFLNVNSLAFIDELFYRCPFLTLEGWRNCSWIQELLQTS